MGLVLGQAEQPQGEAKDIVLESLGTPVVVAAHTNGADEWAAKAAQRTRRAAEEMTTRAQRFREYTDRFVDMRARYIIGLDAERLGRALARRTFETEWTRQLLKKPSSLEPKDKEALRPVMGAASTVFFLRQVLGLAEAWEAEPLALLSVVEQGALLLHAMNRTTLRGRQLTTALANSAPQLPQPAPGAEGAAAPDTNVILRCPVGAEEIAELVLEVTKRIPGLEVAVAEAVDDAVGAFPAAMDALGSAEVSAMDGCALVDEMLTEVFRRLEARVFAEEPHRPINPDERLLRDRLHSFLYSRTGIDGVKRAPELTLTLPALRSPHSAASPHSASRLRARIRGPPAVATPPASVSVPAVAPAPLHQNKLDSLEGHPQRRLTTDDFLSPLSPRRKRKHRPSAAATAAATALASPRSLAGSALQFSAPMAPMPPSPSLGGMAPMPPSDAATPSQPARPTPPDESAQQASRRRAEPSRSPRFVVSSRPPLTELHATSTPGRRKAEEHSRSCACSPHIHCFSIVLGM